MHCVRTVRRSLSARRDARSSLALRPRCATRAHASVSPPGAHMRLLFQSARAAAPACASSSSAQRARQVSCAALCLLCNTAAVGQHQFDCVAALSTRNSHCASHAVRRDAHRASEHSQLVVQRYRTLLAGFFFLLYIFVCCLLCICVCLCVFVVLYCSN